VHLVTDRGISIQKPFNDLAVIIHYHRLRKLVNG
jgi:hypothetical protein